MKKKKKKKPKKIKESQVDSVFSKYIRTRDGWRCVFCGYRENPPTNSIQNSHFYNRGKRSVRFDVENCDALCSKCHRKHELNKNGQYFYFKLHQLGTKRFHDLYKRSISFVKYSQSDYQEMIEKFNRMTMEIEEGDDIILGKH